MAKVTAAMAKVASAFCAEVTTIASATRLASAVASVQRPNTPSAPSAGQTSSTRVRIERSSSEESNSDPPRNEAGPNRVMPSVSAAVKTSPAGNR